MTVFHRITRGRRSRLTPFASGDGSGGGNLPPDGNGNDGSGGDNRPPRRPKLLGSVDDWVVQHLSRLFVRGYDSEDEVRVQAERIHDMEFEDNRASLREEQAALEEEASRFEDEAASLRQQRDVHSPTVEDSGGGKEWSLWRVLVAAFLVCGLVGSLLGGLTYSTHQAELAGTIQGPAQASLLVLCLVAVALFLHVIVSCLPNKAMQIGALCVQAAVGIVAAVLFWHGMASNASVALPMDGPFDPMLFAAAPEGGSGSMAFYFVEAMATSLFLTLLLQYLADIGPRQLPNPTWVALDNKHRELLASHRSIPVRRQRVEDALQAIATHRDACVDALAAAWRIKRDAHTYRINTEL